jgi:hypothetical protein
MPVTQSAVLVTSDGRRVLPEGDEFFLTLGRLAPGSEAGGFAVRNLGFIKFQALADGVTAIELHPPSVDHRALMAAERRVTEATGARFRIVFLDAGRQSEPALSVAETIDRLRALRTPPAQPIQTERFHVEPQDYARLLREVDHPLRLMSDKWRDSFGEFDSTVLPFAADHKFLPRMLIAEFPKRGDDPVFGFIGGDFPWLDSEYRRRAIGEKLETLPDRQYGAWVAGFYKSVALCGEPRFDRVTALVHTGEDQGSTYAARYERLLLPWRTATGETVVSLLARRLGCAPGMLT